MCWRASSATLIILCYCFAVQTTGTAGSRFARDDKDQDWDPSWEKSDYPESGLSKLLRRDARVISPAGMFGGKESLRLAAQKSRPHAPLAPLHSAPP